MPTIQPLLNTVDISKISKGRRFVKAIASRSLIPLLLMEVCVEAGRDLNAYKRGGFTEFRERATEEFMGALFWFTAIPGIDALLDKIVGKKILKLPTESFDVGKDNARNSIRTFIQKHPERFDINDKEAAKKLLAKYRVGKIAAAVLIANGIMGFALPKVNQAITRALRKNNSDNTKNTISTPLFTMEQFIKDSADSQKNKKDVSFGSTVGLFKFINAFENTPKYQLLSEDVGVATGRAICARNKYERIEILFRDLTSCFFYMFNMPIVAGLLNRIEHGDKRRLDPVSSKVATDHFAQVLKENGGKMSAEAFEKAIFGDSKLASKLTPELAEKIAQSEGHIKLSEFLKMFKDIDVEKATRMSQLQPKLAGDSILTKVQIEDLLKGGKANSPEFLHDMYKIATSNDLLFKVKPAKYNKDCAYVSEESLLKVKGDVKTYVKEIIAKAKKSGKEITEEMLTKASKRNYGLNALNWITGFVISAAFLSTFIPKIQYWITKKLTGSSEFPGTADDMNQKKVK